MTELLFSWNGRTLLVHCCDTGNRNHAIVQYDAILIVGTVNAQNDCKGCFHDMQFGKITRSDLKL